MPYVCPECGTRTKSPKGLSLHRHIRHNVEPPSVRMDREMAAYKVEDEKGGAPVVDDSSPPTVVVDVVLTLSDGTEQCVAGVRQVAVVKWRAI